MPVAAGADGEVEIGLAAGLGAARIDHHQPGAARSARRHDALIDDRMAPGGVRADQDEKVGVIEILVAAGHHVLAEGAAVTGDGRGHAQP